MSLFPNKDLWENGTFSIFHILGEAYEWLPWLGFSIEAMTPPMAVLVMEMPMQFSEFLIHWEPGEKRSLDVTNRQMGMIDHYQEENVVISLRECSVLQRWSNPVTAAIAWPNTVPLVYARVNCMVTFPGVKRLEWK